MSSVLRLVADGALVCEKAKLRVKWFADSPFSGWLDLLVLKYSHAVNHYTSLNLTKLDILDTFPTIKVAVAYKVDGQLLTSFPANLRKLQRCEVVYEELPGWMTESTGVKTFEELPLNARRYVEFVEEKVGVRIQWIGTGPKREDMITR